MIGVPPINLEIFNTLLLLHGRSLSHTHFERFGGGEGPSEGGV
jgi:hypothetical protein